MSEYKILVETQPDSKQVNFVDEQLKEFNVDKIGDYRYLPLFLFICDSKNNVVGGLDGFMGLKWFNISTLWIANELRGLGYGKALLKKAEQKAYRHGCLNAYLS